MTQSRGQNTLPDSLLIEERVHLHVWAL